MTKEEFLTRYSKHLNDQQLEAVQAVNGPVLLLAVPGSGKTTVLVNRLGYMLYVEGIAPENILTLTYTVAATNDMARRFESVFGEDYSSRLEFRTINGICSKIISRYGRMIGKDPFELVSEEKNKARILTDILAKHLPEYPTESDVKATSTLITYCKNMRLKDKEIGEIGEEEDIPLLEVFQDYNGYLRSNRLMDYDDQMSYALTLLQKSPELLDYYRDQYKYICVDEAQDTSKIQHIIINMLAGSDGNLFMVGDEDQSIYGFRAAYPEALLNFEKAHVNARVLVMDRNYRSNAKIVSVADAFIQKNQARHEKHMVATRSEGAEVSFVELKRRANQYSYLTKIAADCKEETAVLYRDNECVLPLVDRLDRQGIPYRIKNMDMAYFTNRVVLDVTNIMRFALNPKNTELFMKIYFKCQTYLRKPQAEQMCKISAQKDIPVLEAAEHMSGLNGMVIGKCRGMATNLKSMLNEEPSKAIFRIENPMGYGEYMERNGIDQNKLYILKQLSYNENSIEGFLKRLDYLQEMLKNSKPDYDCPFILSTIHSSKGLEYKKVFLMDVCDGVFPNKVLRSVKNATPKEIKDFEEERRLFYVGMTRAKDSLSICKITDGESCFINEALKSSSNTKPARIEQDAVQNKTILTNDRRNNARLIGNNYLKKQGNLVSDYELTVGEIVISEKYGKGFVKEVEYGKSGMVDKFTVEFDSGETKSFLFPFAFQHGMKLASGVEVEIKYGSR